MKYGIQITPVLFFVINGILVFFVVFFAVRFLNRRNSSQFRDDLWAEARAKAKDPKHVQKTVDFLAFEEAKNPDSSHFSHSTHSFRTPNFEGRPHEILGIPADADERTIQAAYKHWIKRYHPDRVEQLGPAYRAQANRRTEQINEARVVLLKRFAK